MFNNIYLKITNSERAASRPRGARGAAGGGAGGAATRARPPARAPRQGPLPRARGTSSYTFFSASRF